MRVLHEPPKQNAVYYCPSCGYNSKKVGRCPNCGSTLGSKPPSTDVRRREE
jgi:rubrerythrin